MIYHVYCQVGAEEQINDSNENDKHDEEEVGDAETNDIAHDKVDVDSNDQHGEGDCEQFGDQTIGEVPHDGVVAGEGDGGDDSEGEHERHETVEEIIHTTQVLDVFIESNHECWQNCNGSCEQDSLPLLPLQVEESLHGKLTRVCSCHGGGLSCGQ